MQFEDIVRCQTYLIQISESRLTKIHVNLGNKLQHIEWAMKLVIQMNGTDLTLSIAAFEESSKRVGNAEIIYMP